MVGGVRKTPAPARARAFHKEYQNSDGRRLDGRVNLMHDGAHRDPRKARNGATGHRKMLQPGRANRLGQHAF